LSTDLDVAILGGGLAGNLLARQLARSVPKLRIGLFEKSTESSWRSASPVEITATPDQAPGVSRYLYDRHLRRTACATFETRRARPAREMSDRPISPPFHPRQPRRARLGRICGR
jgi:2-polyprenyl-6-methoxyphenol hydroxylase-like FAD-dependent oxidoreductase